MGLVGLLAIAVLVLIGLEVAVRQPAVRRAVEQRLAAVLTERTGLSLEVDDLRASLFKGLVEIDGLTLGSPGEVAILATDHIEVEWRLSSLWRRPFTLERLIITAPKVDLTAPLPTRPVTSEQGQSDFALGVDRFELIEGRIDGSVLPPELRTWIEAWWMEDLSLAGWYGPQGLDLELDSRLRWQRTDGMPVDIAVDGRLQGPQQGPWEVTRLTLDGQGLVGR